MQNSVIYNTVISFTADSFLFNTIKMKKRLGETQTLRALWLSARPPVTHPQTGPITIHCAAASSSRSNDIAVT